MVANEDIMLFTYIWFQESSQTIDPDTQKTTQTAAKLSRVHFPVNNFERRRKYVKVQILPNYSNKIQSPSVRDNCIKTL